MRTLVSALVVALALIALPTGRQAESGTFRMVPYGGTIRRDATTSKFRLVVQKNGTHTAKGVARPSCEGANLRYEPRPVSKYAGPPSAMVDGSLLKKGVSVGAASVQGRRVLINFTKNGSPISCRDVFKDEAANVWVSGFQFV